MTGARERLGRTGVFLGHLSLQPAAGLRRDAAHLEQMGFTTLWVGEAWGREALTQSALLLAATSRVTIATGIASIWARDPVAMINAARTLEEAWPQRFVLGIGASHAQLVQPRGHDYGRPVSAMRAHLAAMREARYVGPPPGEEPPVLLAALGPRMLELAAAETAGAFTYFVPVAHTRQARAALGSAPLLGVEQAVVPGVRSREEARAVAGDYAATYIALENYANNLRRLGYADSELTGSGGDRLFDDVIAWGSDAAIAERIAAHVEAGADHVAIQVIIRPGESPIGSLDRLSPLLR